MDSGLDLDAGGRSGRWCIRDAFEGCRSLQPAQPHVDASVSHPLRRLTTAAAPSVHCSCTPSCFLANLVVSRVALASACTRVLRRSQPHRPQSSIASHQLRQDVPHLHVHMTDHRRISATASPSIPPAPPPPPPKIKGRSYFERFVAQPLQSAGYASRPPSVQAHRPDGGPLNPLVPKLLG
jgi:hypothetical protein